MVPHYTEINPQTYAIERSILDATEAADNLAELDAAREIERIERRRDMVIALEEFCLHERFMRRFRAGEFDNREKKLKRRVAKSR